MVECKHLDEEDENGSLISQETERLEDGFAIGGCCVGGCYIIRGIIYCPFCGEKLK